MLANLLGDQAQLQLVVLNSCEGARTTLTDPFAGVATTLIQSGVPAVVAMQFEISDEAAIVFAEELYTNLIGRQDPIDAAVAEARKAVFVEVDELEWATPVLFLRDPAIALFSFEVDAAPLPVAAPMDLLIPSVSPFLPAASPAATGPWPPPTRPGPTGADVRRRDLISATCGALVEVAALGGGPGARRQPPSTTRRPRRAARGGPASGPGRRGRTGSARARRRR